MLARSRLMVVPAGAEEFELAAKTILKRLPDAMAYAGADEPQITGHIPLPKEAPNPAVELRPLLRFSLRPGSGSEGVQGTG